MAGIFDLLMQAAKPTPRRSRGGGGGSSASAPRSFSEMATQAFSEQPRRQGGSSSYTAPRQAAAPTRQAVTSGSRTLQPYIGTLSEKKTQEPSKEKREERGTNSGGLLFGGAPLDGTSVDPTPRTERVEEVENYGAPRIKQMSRKEFAQLTPEQQAAVRFNTVLVQAREKDLNNQGKYTADREQKKKYNELVTDMFGEHGGSETYAPETVQVLKQLDFDKIGDDLDDYLGLRTAVTASDLTGFRKRQGESHLLTQAFEKPRYDNSAEGRVFRTEKFADLSAKLRESLARKGRLMTDYAGSLALDRNEGLLKIGGEINKVKPELGYGENSDRPEEKKNVDKAFNMSYGGFALAPGGAELERDRDEGWYKLLDASSREDLNAFFRMSDTRTQLAKEFDLPVARTDKKGGRSKLRTPEEYREYLGLGKLKGDI